MFILITGGSKSGKSSIAEKMAVSSGLSLYYVASMIPYGEDCFKIIERHRKMRSGKGFITIEKYTDVSEIEIPEKSAVLLECIGNLCANEMFSSECECASEKIFGDISVLNNKSELLIAVTNQTGDDGIVYESGTMNYISELGRLNCRLCKLADCVIESVFGIPLILKGEKPNCL